MKKKNCFKSNFIRICACLITLLIAHPLCLFAEQADIDKVVKIKNNLITMNPQDEATFNQLTNTEVMDVLKKIEKETGVKMTIGNGLAGKKVETDFVDLDMESALRRLLNGTYYVLSYEQDPENKEKQILKEVKAGGAELGTIPLKGKVTSIEIPYGSDKGEVGAVIGSEGSSRGPLAFAVDNEGILYVCDSVNNRIQIFTSAGNYLSTIFLKSNEIAEDIVIDKSGFLYILDSMRKLHQYSKNGEVISTLAINDNRARIRAPMQIINSEIYLRVGEEDIFIAKASEGKLVKPSEFEIEKNKKDIKKGKLESSGRRYKGKRYAEGLNVDMEVIEKDGRKSIVVSFPPRKEIVSGPSLGEDNRGDLYFTNSRREDKFQMFNIDKFNTDMEYIGSAQIPGGDHSFYSVKDFHMSEDSKVYHFIPEKEKLKIYVLTIEDK